LIRLGVQSGDRVVLMMPTLPVWEYCQLAILGIGGVVVGIDAHDAPENIRHILQTVSPKALFLASAMQIDLLRELFQNTPDIIVTMEPGSYQGSVSFSNLLAVDSEVGLALPKVEAGNMATIIFTSGSTGQPKGIAYTHGQLCLAGEVILSRFPSITEESRLACWLPMSNLFQRIINLCAIMRGAQCYFVESPGDIISRLPEIRPALFIGVPRFFEKLYTGIQTKVANQPWISRQAVHLAWRIGERFHSLRREGGKPPLWLAAAHDLLDTLILRRLRGIMGSELQFMISGSAPMPTWLLEKMHGLGWLVLEAYGISECVVPIAINAPDAYRFGSVGRPLPGNEIRLAEDGELLVRGSGVFTGYYRGADIDTPLDAEAFLHTGDFARVDDDGFIWLTGRKSEVFKTSTGRRIAPAPIEAQLKQLAYVEHAVIFGRNRPMPVALLCINPDAFPDVPQASPFPVAVLQAISLDLASACAPLPAYQRPAGVLISRRGLSIIGGGLTSNLKLRRGAIEDQYRSDIEALYQALEDSTQRSRCLVLEVA